MSDATRNVERKQYSQELKAEAVGLVLEQGYTCDEAGQKLGVPPKTLANWARPHRKQNRLKQISVGVENNDPTALRAQIAELHKQLRRAEMERDILKKFSQYAATQMPGGLT
jgi:transposase